MTHTACYNHAIHSIEAFMNCGLKWIELNPLPDVVGSGLSTYAHTEPHPTAIHVLSLVYIAVHLGLWVSLGALSSVQLVYSSGVNSSTPPLPHSVMREIAEDTSPFRMRAAECRFSFDVVVPRCYLSPSIEI